MYIRHPNLSSDPEHYIPAFEIIQKDLVELFDYVEPDDINLSTFSYRIHQLFVRCCIEIEANFKAILKENQYVISQDYNIKDYHKTEKSHFLSRYEIKLPFWRGHSKFLKPFEAWSSKEGRLEWYQHYNSAKHDRHAAFTQANLDNLLQAVSALAVLLCSQFLDGCFQSEANLLATFEPLDPFEKAIGGYFRVKFPTDIPPEERYDFDWSDLEAEPDPFVNFPYTCA